MRCEILGRLAIVLALLGATANAAPVEEITQLPSEGGALLPYLRVWDDEIAPTALAGQFNGGGGHIGLLERGIPRPRANFLVRSSALFLAQGIATALIETPTDQHLMSGGFGASAGHARDVAAVVKDLQAKFAGLPVFLIGSSRGTVSAAHAGDAQA